GFNNLAVMLVKGTAAVGLVLLNDITFEANQARITNGVWAAFGSALLIYLVIALIVSTLFRWMERRAQHRLGLWVKAATTTKATAEAEACHVSCDLRWEPSRRGLPTAAGTVPQGHPAGDRRGVDPLGRPRPRLGDCTTSAPRVFGLAVASL